MAAVRVTPIVADRAVVAPSMDRPTEGELLLM